MSKRNYILLVDANNIISRSAHANSSLTTKKKGKITFTGGIYGTVRSIQALTWEAFYQRIAGVVMIYDRGRPAYRKRLCPEYKANRTPFDQIEKMLAGKLKKSERQKLEMIKKVFDQCQRSPKFLSSLGVANIWSPGWEADDVAGYLVREVFTKERFPKHRVLLYSSDGDWSQLVGKRVHQRKPGKDGEFLKSVDPQFRLMKTIVGDMADNLKGVLGIGDVKAGTLLTETFGARTPKQLRRAIKNGIDATKGPAKLVMEQWTALNAQFRATSMKGAVAQMKKEKAKFELLFTGFNEKRFTKKCRALKMFSLIQDDGDVLASFGSAYTKGRMAGVFDALQELV